ncbi:MAG: hypothetical protein VYD54_05945 [Bdellovibrionota bacterium]|nr:hypothetical protein [Bdellovibrionota bacterium]
MDKREESQCCTVCGNSKDSTFIVAKVPEGASEEARESYTTARICKSCQVYSLKSLLMAANIIKNFN